MILICIFHSPAIEENLKFEMSTIVSKDLKLPSKSKSALQAANFYHLYWDVAWFGVAFGSTLSFLPVFATRLGASGWQVGLLTAGSALVSILFTLPAGRWLEGRSLGPVVTRAAFWHRLGYFLFIPLPLVLPASIQVWTIILMTILMAIPGTMLMIGFNALLAATVVPEWRGYVVGRRNALLAAMIMVSFWFSGWLLDQLANMPLGSNWGYAAVFTLGALGMGLSTYHLYRIRVPDIIPFQGRLLSDNAQPGRAIGFTGATPRRLTVGLRLWFNQRLGATGNFSRISNRYRRAMLAFFLFHFSQLLPTALFPLFWVREVGLTDGVIGWINAVFYLTMLAVSPLLSPLTRRLGNHRLTAGGAVLLTLYPLFTALSTDLTLLLLANLVGGSVWAILSGSLSNRLLELIPEDDRPAHLAVYNLILNVAILSGTMLGPSVADWFGLREALFIICILRLGSGLALARWG